MPKRARRRLTRRAVLSGIARGAAALSVLGTVRSARANTAMTTNTFDTVVVGAGVFGAWTAWELRRAGKRVLLIDAFGPAHARASSGGESRMTRTAYGPDELYARMAWESLEQWQWLSARAGLPVFHRLGVLFFFARLEPYVTQTLAVHKKLALPTETLDHASLAKRWPQVSWDGIEIGLFEPELGALVARRAVQTLVAEYTRAGGEYRLGAALPPNAGENGELNRLRLAGGDVLAANKWVFACGPWLPKLWPELLGSKIFPTRQEVFFFTPPAGDTRFSPGALPGWADFNNGDIFYGFPDLEARGFKIAHDQHGPAIDPDSGDRTPSPAALAEVRAYMARRFPALADRPLAESRVCQYENTSNGDLLIDRHPELGNVWLVGGGSGHGFKHGPAVGRLAAELVLGDKANNDPRLGLATKQALQQRAVH